MVDAAFMSLRKPTVLVVALGIGGCLAGESSSISVKRAGGVTFGIGLALLATSVVQTVASINPGCTHSICGDNPRLVVFGTGIAAVAAGLVMAVVGQSVRDGEVQHVVATDRASARAKHAREWATLLMKTATAAAIAGDCANVQTIESTVHSVDPDFHDTVFVLDADIATCLGMSR